MSLWARILAYQQREELPWERDAAPKRPDLWPGRNLDLDLADSIRRCEPEKPGYKPRVLFTISVHVDRFLSRIFLGP